MVRTAKRTMAKREVKRVAPKTSKTEETKPVVRRKKWEVTARDWARYQKNPTHEVRQRLLNKYVPLVRNVAARMAMGFPRSVELSDLINTGVIGLIEAFGNYDPERGVKFETYSVPRIRGAILDELRALDWVPRSTRAKSREIDRATVSLENILGRKPGQVELAKKMDMPVNDFYAALDDVSSTSMLSLDEIVYPDDDNRQVPRIETV
ncbi:MAG: sigma-70 family RNA polymerase sigma factor, partial [candidate division Zixibacteria bacterium]